MRYVSSNSDSLGRKSPSNVGSFCRWSTSSSELTSLPARLLGLPPDGGQRGRLSPPPKRDARKPPPIEDRHPVPLSPESPSFHG